MHRAAIRTNNIGLALNSHRYSSPRVVTPRFIRLARIPLRSLHTPVHRYPNIKVIEDRNLFHHEIDEPLVESIKLALPGQGKDHWDAAEIEVHPSTVSVSSVVPPCMRFLHGKVKLNPQLDTTDHAIVKRKMEVWFASQLYQLTPSEYEEFWRENGHHLLEAFRNGTFRHSDLLMLPDEEGQLHRMQRVNGEFPEVSPVSELEKEAYAMLHGDLVAKEAMKETPEVEERTVEKNEKKTKGRRHPLLLLAILCIVVAMVLYLLRKNESRKKKSEKKMEKRKKKSEKNVESKKRSERATSIVAVVPVTSKNETLLENTPMKKDNENQLEKESATTVVSRAASDIARAIRGL